MYPNDFDAPFGKSIYEERYRHPEDINWTGTTKRVIGSTTGALYEAPKAQARVSQIQALQERLSNLMGYRKFCPGGRYLYAAGRDFHQVNNCVLLRAEDSREGWAGLAYKSAMALMTGAGIGVWYGDIRAAGSSIKRTGGEASGPLPLANLVNDQGRCYLQGGNRRSAIWAGMPWWHADIFDFIKCKDWSDEIIALKKKDWKFAATMDTTNISVTLDDDFFDAYQHYLPEIKGTLKAPDGSDWKHWARRVYETAVSHMLKHGEPGFTIDTGDHAGEVLRNACTEITSADDSDVCNLGALVMPRFDSAQKFGAAVRDAVMFLTAGTIYSHVPYDQVVEVREKNRRLGLGRIGLHEFLIKNGVRYGSDEGFELLDPYMREYARACEYAQEQQDALGLTPSVAATAQAPQGTTGAVMESTPSDDPIFCAAEIRTVKTASPSGDIYRQHVIVDPTAARLVREGVDPAAIEDAHTLALDPERRFKQQVFCQSFTDHAISSTINIPAPITNPREVKDFGDMMIKYLPDLRGITVYPDGARAGQPRKPCNLSWALENVGTIYETDLETCAGGVCGI